MLWLRRDGVLAAARALLIGEPLLVLALAPLAWSPSQWSILLVAALPGLWLARRVVFGRFSAPTPYDTPMRGLAIIAPLLVPPVVDWSVAAPKLLSVVIGIALVYA